MLKIKYFIKIRRIMSIMSPLIDALDRRILYEWDLDARASASAIAKRIGSKKETVNARMKRLQTRGVVTGFVTEIDTAKLGYDNIKVYLQFQHFSHELEQAFFAYLRTIKEVGWIVGCSGRWDALFCVWSKDQHHFHEVLLAILTRFSKHILHKEIIHNINWFYYNRKWLKPDALPHAVKYERASPVLIDDLDRQLLKLIVRDARKSIVSIATAAGETSQTIINRKKRLEQAGVITKYSLSIDHAKMGLIFTKTFVYLQEVTRARLQDLYRYCAEQPNIFAVTTALGAWDVEIELEVENFEQMRRIMDELRVRFSDIVKNYESVIITEQSGLRYIWE